MKSSITITFLLAYRVAAHGFVKSILADGSTYQGYNPEFQWQNPIPTVAGWSNPRNIELGFVNDYGSSDLACHLGATPGKSYVHARAGGTVQVEWTPWPDSHKGPVIDYLAACNGDCTTVEKTNLLWNKIAESGLVDGSTIPGKFASDVLLQAGNKWTIKIPSSLAPGNYVLRHEIIALHEGNRQGGAQNYPQCINLKISGSGSNTLASTGTAFDKLYTSSDPGILCDIYRKLGSYSIPGPALFSGSNASSSGTQNFIASSPAWNITSATSFVGTVTNSPSTFQTSTRATTTIMLSDSNTRAAVETGMFSSSPTGKARKFVCYEELL